MNINNLIANSKNSEFNFSFLNFAKYKIIERDYLNAIDGDIGFFELGAGYDNSFDEMGLTIKPVDGVDLGDFSLGDYKDTIINVISKIAFMLYKNNPINTENYSKKNFYSPNRVNVSLQNIILLQKLNPLMKTVQQFHLSKEKINLPILIEMFKIGCSIFTDDSKTFEKLLSSCNVDKMGMMIWNLYNVYSKFSYGKIDNHFTVPLNHLLFDNGLSFNYSTSDTVLDISFEKGEDFYRAFVGTLVKREFAKLDSVINNVVLYNPITNTLFESCDLSLKNPYLSDAIKDIIEFYSISLEHENYNPHENDHITTWGYPFAELAYENEFREFKTEDGYWISDESELDYYLHREGYDYHPADFSKFTDT